MSTSLVLPTIPYATELSHSLTKNRSSLYFRQILQVTAVDLDTGNNARLTYRIVGGDQMFQQHQSSAVGRGQHGSRNTTTTAISKTPIALHTSTPFTDDVSELFGIFPNSGWIYLRGILDREAREQYDITVLASDNGTPSATATTHVIVNVLDANDNDPTFSRDSYEFSVEENVKRGAVIGQLSATDADLGVNAAVRFSLIPSNTSFQVNPNTGESNSELLFVYYVYFFSRSSYFLLARESHRDRRRHEFVVWLFAI